jgi:hypothetical protein
MDWTKVLVDAVAALTPVIVGAAVWALKAAYAKIPASWIFIITPILGILINYGTGWIEAHVVNYPAAVAAVLGLLAVVLREFISTLQVKGLGGSVSQTKGMF